MADSVLYSRRMYRRRKIDANRLLVGVIVLLTIVIAGELAFHLLVAPNLVIQKVVVESELALSDAEILRLAGLRSKEYYFALDSEEIRRRLESFPQVRKAAIEKVFPDTVRIVLYGRKPLAISLTEIGGRTVPMSVDREGMIFQMGDDVERLDLPVISGLRFESVRPGTRLPDTLVSFLADLERLQSASPNLFRLISEYRIVRNGEYGYDVLLYPVHHPVPVRIGSEIDERLCTYIMMVLDVIDTQKLASRMDEIDFRTGEVIYRVREG